ncbi:MAG: nitroreductase family protein [Kofleriaceae bacterium]
MGASRAVEILRGAVACAVLAPSTHNTQPWRFRRRGEVVELWADDARQLAVIDPMRRQLFISCGCALYNARVAIRAEGFTERVDVLPRPDQPNLIAVVRVGLPRAATDLDRALVAAIPRRHTNRRRFLDRPVAAPQAEALAHAAAAERVHLFRLAPAAKRALAALVAECDRRRFAEPAYRQQVGEWLVPAGRRRADGIPFVEKEYGSAGWFAQKKTLADADLGAQAGSLEEDRIASAPLVAVLATDRDDDLDWVDCGQALEAVLLRATVDGLAAAFVDQLLEYEDLHAAVQDLTGSASMPQMVLRLGYAPPVERTAPRRPLAEVFDESD